MAAVRPETALVCEVRADNVPLSERAAVTAGGSALGADVTAAAPEGATVGAGVERAGAAVVAAGAGVGCTVGAIVGTRVAVGAGLGLTVGGTGGRGVCTAVACGVGTRSGREVVAAFGVGVGRGVGGRVGAAVGAGVARAVGAAVGATLGAGVGGCVGLGVPASGVAAGGKVDSATLGAGLGSSVGRDRSGGATTAMRSGWGVPCATIFASSGRRKALFVVRGRWAIRGRGVRTSGGTMRGFVVARASGFGVATALTMIAGAAVGARVGAAGAGTAVGADASSRTISLICGRCSRTVKVCSASEPPESDGCTTSSTISRATMRWRAIESA